MFGGSDQFKTVNEEFYGDSKHQRLMDEELQRKHADTQVRKNFKKKTEFMCYVDAAHNQGVFTQP